MKNFCETLKKHAKIIIDFEKWPKRANKKRAKITSRCKGMLHLKKKKLIKEFAKDKNHQKVRDHCYYTGKYGAAAHSIYNSKFNVPNEIVVVFCNGSNYDCHFIIKVLAKNLKDNLHVLEKKLKSTKPFPFQ